MVGFEHQGDLFLNKDIDYSSKSEVNDIYINKIIIKEWQNKIINYQSKFFTDNNFEINQVSLFEAHSEKLFRHFNPLNLTPLPLNFWRWPKPPHEGPAIYFVIDNTVNPKQNIVLYIGETLSADKRWKGDHDCKSYLSNYSEILQKAGLTCKVNIRFWIDVPNETRARRKLEKKLIETWLPPFNKETRGYWATPFTSQLN